MIEAVNSVVANAQVLRGNAEQASGARSLATDLDSVQETSVSVPQAPYLSLIVSVNYDYDKAVLQLRDSNTGDVIDQFPSESTLSERQRSQAVAAPQQTVQVSEGSDTSGVASDSTVSVPEVGTSAGVAEAQVASAALATGAQAGVESLSAGVSVVA